MKFVCERCHTRYSIADDKVRQKILKIRCKTCENVITVRDHASTSGLHQTSHPPVPPARGTTPPPASAREWFVAVNGDQVGPVTRGEAARRIADSRSDDEVYVWKEGLDGWKVPREVPQIENEVNALRARTTRPPPPPRPTPPPPLAAPRAPTKTSGGRSAPAAAARPSPMAASASASAPVSASLAEQFTEEDRTQIQPFDAAVLAGDVLNRGGGAGSLLPFSKAGKSGGNGLPAPAPAGASAKLGGLFSDLPAAPASPGGPFLQAPPSFHAPTHAESGLSRLQGLPGFMSRNPGLKFVAAGAVVVVLIALVVIVLVIVPGEQKAPPPPVLAASEKAAPTEAEARREAADKFQATVPTPAKTASIGAARTDRSDRRKTSRPAPRPSLNPPPTGSLEPGPLGDPNQPPAQRTAAPGERVVPAYQPARSAEASTSSTSRGAPSDAQIHAVVNKRENKMAITACYERALKRDEKLKSGGKIMVTATVGISGMVKSVALSAPPDLAPLEPCIKQAVRRFSFPASNEEFSIEFPLIMAGTL
jgi:predicted Zn finger-like uncharacterized protein